MKKSIGIYFSKNNLQVVIINKGLGRLKLVAADSIKLLSQTAAINQPVFSAVSGGTTSNMGQEYLTGEKIKKQQEAEGLKNLMSYQAALSELLKKHHIRQGETVTMALPPELMAVRYFQMPRLGPQECKTAVPFEARKFIPYKLEDTVYAYTISYEKVASIKMAVTFVAAERAAVANYIKFIESVGLKVEYLEPIPYSLTRLFYYSREIEIGQTAALVHIGRESANIALVRNKVLYLTRNVSFFSKIGQVANMQFLPGSLDFSQDVSGAVKHDSLLSETRLSFDYFHRQFPEEKVEKMIVWSDDKKAYDWGKDIGKELNVSVKVSNPLEILDGGQNCSVDYAPACGLALRSFYDTEKGVNLSPAFKNIAIEHLVKVAIIEIVIAMIGLFMFFAMDVNKTKELQLELNKMKKQRSAEGDEIGSLSGASIAGIKQKSEQKLNYLQNLIENKRYLSVKIAKIAELLPEGLWLSDLNFSKPKNMSKYVLTIKGYSYKAKGEDQIKTVNQFLDNLKKNNEFMSGFSDIRLDYAQNEKYAADISVTSFQISCNME